MASNLLEHSGQRRTHNPKNQDSEVQKTAKPRAINIAKIDRGGTLSGVNRSIKLCDQGVDSGII